MKSFLEEKYKKEVVPILMKEFDIKNILAVPKIVKVVVNSGVGQLARDKEKLEVFKKELGLITGQMPSERKARVSVSGFNIRKGMVVGLKVTLRKRRMYEFLYKLFSIVLPRLRDFKGVSTKGFDSQGNYTLGLSEHTVFPEIDVAKTTPRGLEITIVTNSKDKEKTERLLSLLGMPFSKEG